MPQTALQNAVEYSTEDPDSCLYPWLYEDGMPRMILGLPYRMPLWSPCMRDQEWNYPTYSLISWKCTSDFKCAIRDYDVRYWESSIGVGVPWLRWALPIFIDEGQSNKVNWCLKFMLNHMKLIALRMVQLLGTWDIVAKPPKLEWTWSAWQAWVCKAPAIQWRLAVKLVSECVCLWMLLEPLFFILSGLV